MRYPKAGVLYISAAVMWIGAATLLITQLDGVTAAPLATFCAIVAMTVTTPACHMWMANRLDRAAPDTDATLQIDRRQLVGALTTAASSRVYQGGAPVDVEIEERHYWRVYSDVVQDVLAENDSPDGGADSVQ